MQADHRQRSWSCGAADHSAAVCGASGAIRTQAAFGICAYRKTSQTNSAAIMPVCAQYAAVEPPLICLRRSADRFTAESPSTVAASATSAIGTASRIIAAPANRSEEHTSELQSLMRNSYAVFCLKTKHN